MRFTRRRQSANWLAAVALLLSTAIAHAQELRPFPRADELARYDNPLEAGALPISPPERVANGEHQSRWRLPYEGKVSMLQFRHPADDSPLLIARHYAGQLREQGFELVTICDIPCAGRADSPDASVYWFHELDLAKKLQYNYFGDRGLYLIAHRADAVVAVRVGSSYNGYASVIKTVAAAQLDLAPLLAYVEQRRAPVADAALPPPPGRGSAGTAPGVQAVAPAAVNAWVRDTKGFVVVQLSSHDPGCGYCGRSHPAFNALAAAEARTGVTFARVAFHPWRSVSQNDFATQHGVSGLPTYFAFKDGQLVRRRDGMADEATLRQALLDGLR